MGREERRGNVFSGGSKPTRNGEGIERDRDGVSSLACPSWKTYLRREVFLVMLLRKQARRIVVGWGGWRRWLFVLFF